MQSCHMIRRALLVAGLAAASAAPAVAAPVQWAGNGHWYLYVSPFESWEDWDGAMAAAAAASPIAGYSPHLLTVTSAAELAFVQASVTDYFVWTAGSDAGDEGVFSWRAGPETGNVFWNNGPVPGGFAPWAPGEPNNALGGEDCVHLNLAPEFNDLACSYALPYVIEWSPLPVPEPGSWALMLIGLGAAGLGIRRRRTVPA